MARVALLVLSLSMMHTACLRHVARGPASTSSFTVSTPQAFEIRDIASTSSLNALVDREVRFPDGANDMLIESKSTADIINSIVWLLNKARAAYSIWTKGQNVKLALGETKELVEDATRTVERMGSKLVRVHDYLMKTGLEAFMQCIEDGNLDALANNSGFLDAIEELESLADELDELVAVSKKVITIMKHVRGIVADTNDLFDGLLPVDLDVFLTPLEKHLDEAVLQVELFLNKVKAKCANAKESLEEFLQNDLAKGKEYAKEKIEAIFGDLTPLLGDLDKVYNWMVKPLILELAKAVNAIYEAAKRLKLPVDAPASVADESIDAASCSWRQTRWFKSIEDYNVDIEKTMVCDSVKTLGWRFRCRCIGTNDCYIDSKYRPGDKTSRRCFQKA